jgi:hypothetical protein
MWRGWVAVSVTFGLGLVLVFSIVDPQASSEQSGAKPMARVHPDSEIEAIACKLGFDERGRLPLDKYRNAKSDRSLFYQLGFDPWRMCRVPGFCGMEAQFSRRWTVSPGYELSIELEDSKVNPSYQVFQYAYAELREVSARSGYYTFFTSPRVPAGRTR